MDGMELPCSRVSELSIQISKGDVLTIDADGEEILIKYMDDKWQVFCDGKVAFEEPVGISEIKSGFSI